MCLWIPAVQMLCMYKVFHGLKNGEVTFSDTIIYTRIGAGMCGSAISNMYWQFVEVMLDFIKTLSMYYQLGIDDGKFPSDNTDVQCKDPK